MIKAVAALEAEGLTVERTIAYPHIGNSDQLWVTA